LVLAVAGSGLIGVSIARDASAADPSFPVLLDGVGDFDVAGDLVNWQNAMFVAPQPSDFQFFYRGSEDGRRSLLDDRADFTISGAPFTAAELASRPANAPKIIDAPISVASLSMMFTTPLLGGWNTEVIDPNCNLDDPDIDPETCIQRGTYTGPIRVPPENLSALITNLPYTYQGNNLSVWSHPDFVAALGTSSLSIMGRGGQHHTWVNRTEASSANRYLMDYAKEMGPQAWAQRKAENPTFPWEPIGEQFSPRTQSRYGGETQIGVIALARVDAASNGTPDTWTGNAGAMPSTLVQRTIDGYPLAGLREAEIQNANGDWVRPNRQTIEAALAAGGATPNHAARNPVPGAYPIVYINRLYTIAGRLDVDQANAMAATIRYVVTDGQQSVIDNNGAPLTAALRAEALAAADEIVEANCPGPDHIVVSGGRSAFEPDTPGIRSIGTMKHCVPAPPPSTTTTSTTTTVESSTTTSTTTTTTTVAGSAGPTTTTPVTTTPVTTASAPPFTPTPSPPFTPSPSSGGGTPFVPFDDLPLDEEAIEDGLDLGAALDTDADDEASAPSTSVDEAEAASGDGAVAAGGPSEPGAAGGAGTRPRGLALSELPLDAPDDGTDDFQRLGTLLLGAAMFLAARHIVLSRRLATP
jgi:hypothetical protein